jgi:hypothetical protein
MPSLYTLACGERSDISTRHKLRINSMADQEAQTPDTITRLSKLEGIHSFLVALCFLGLLFRGLVSAEAT